MHPRKLKKKLVSYIKFKDLAKSIKMVALSQLNNSKKKIASRAVSLSTVLPYFELKYYTMKEYTTALLIPIGVDKSCCGPHNGNIFKKTEKFMDSLEESQKTFHLLTIGNRVRDYFRKYYSNYLVSHIYNIDKEPLSLVISFAVAEKILSDIKDRYFFIFNRYYSPFLQKTKSYEVAGIKAFLRCMF